MTTARESRYLQYLPAVFHKRPVSEEELPLGQFLLPFEHELTRFDELLAILDRYFSPALLDTELAADFLPWLASWVALILDEEWDEDKRRRLIGEAVELYRWRGTVRGLKRYLEIYTGLPPEAIDIRERRWPGGMQIGVASRIGGVFNAAAKIDATQATYTELQQHDYYVVDTTAPTQHPPKECFEPPDVPAGQRLRLYYPADREKGKDAVERIQFEEEGVRIWYRWYRSSGESETSELFHRRPDSGPAGEQAEPDGSTAPNIARRNGLVDYRVVQPSPPDNGATASDAAPITLRGGTFLVDELERPYHFIVDMRIADVPGPSALTIRQELTDIVMQFVRTGGLDERLGDIERWLEDSSPASWSAMQRAYLADWRARLAALAQRLIQLLQRPLRDPIQAELLALYSDITELRRRCWHQRWDRFNELWGQIKERLHTILLDPLTDKERFIRNEEEPLTRIVQERLTAGRAQLGMLLRAQSLPADWATHVQAVVHVITDIMRIPYITDQTRAALRAVRTGLAALAGGSSPEAVVRSRLENAYSRMDTILHQPLTVVLETLSQEQEHVRGKVRAILDLEKPAHTAYYLRLTPVVHEVIPHWMQIEVHSNVGLDTTIG